MNDQPKGPATPTQKRRAEVARRLREQGLELMAQRGLHACRVEEITAAAGVGKGTFFTHFASKEAFVAELVDQVLDDLARRVAPLGLNPDDAKALIAGVSAVHLRYFQLRPAAASLLVQAVSLPPDSEPGQGVAQRLGRHLDMVAEMCAAAAESLGWPRERARDLALMLLANASGFFWFGAHLGLGQDTPTGLLDKLARALGQWLEAT